MDDSYIFPGDGAAHTKVEFRFVIFRPFMEEIIVGKIKNCSKEGVHSKYPGLIMFINSFLIIDSALANSKMAIVFLHFNRILQTMFLGHVINQIKCISKVLRQVNKWVKITLFMES